MPVFRSAQGNLRVQLLVREPQDGSRDRGARRRGMDTRMGWYHLLIDYPTVTEDKGDLKS